MSVLRDEDQEIVGRADMLAQLTACLRGEGSSEKVRILAISGPGGIGKTFLWQHALRGTDLTEREYLRMSINGQAAGRTLPEMITGELVRSAAPLDPRQHRFVLTHKCRRALESLDAELRTSLMAASNGDAELAKSIHEVIGLGVGALLLFRDANPGVRAAAELGKRLKREHVEYLVKHVKSTPALAQEWRFPLTFGLDPFLSGLRNRLRCDVEKTVADALAGDLAAMLRKYRKQDRRAALPGKVKGLSRLLLILDDYESLQSTLGGFLVDSLVPMLKQADVDTLLVVVGRDRLVDTHPGWQQHHASNLVGELRLTAFTPEEAERYVRMRGVTDDQAVRRLVQDTAGFPFLLAGEVDDELSGGRTALGLKRFFDRITRWMTPQQRAWLAPLAFLDAINLEQIRRMMPEESAEEVLAWFKSEASIRAPDAPKWVMLPIVRSRVQDCVRNDSAELFAEYRRRAAAT